MIILWSHGEEWAFTKGFVIKKGAQSDSKQGIAVEGMFEGDQQERTAADISEGKEKPAEEAEDNGNGIKKNGMGIGEEHRIDQNGDSGWAKKCMVSPEKKTAEYYLLYQGRDQGIGYHEDTPEYRFFPRKVKKILGEKAQGDQQKKGENEQVTFENSYQVTAS